MDAMTTELDSRVYVDILGETFTIRGDAEPGYIAEVARLVDLRMRDLKAAFPSINRHKIAVLAAINLADELLQERSHCHEQDYTQSFLERTRQLITMLDEGLVGDTLRR